MKRPIDIYLQLERVLLDIEAMGESRGPLYTQVCNAAIDDLWPHLTEEEVAWLNSRGFIKSSDDIKDYPR